ncbi:LOW QUALITY PROTEIN: leucine-rich repeat-containing protein 75A [Leucoraja erinacea]|uniref:LOW QUALITY PROTEIN: leucine-rich repeat-containing protein 75A n=1 Tax=Leucoraja erinaceus TaxID=7782 RepID=UPI00245463ED|nr:LOW QUALITY PROTEIN: leucine-rich repeat-containing protein 75A [Leucoraja erinacea]
MGGKQAKGRPRAGAAQAPNRDHPHPPGGQRAEGRGGAPAPYQRRIGLIHDMAMLAKQGRQQEAAQLLRSLRQDLGMESTSLDDVLCRYASFRNLVDPITHELIVSLARYIHCPKPEGDAAGGLEKICRQLTHHLSPHSRCKRQGLLKRKPQACLKAVLSASGPSESLDLSGIALSGRDLQRVALYLRESWETLCSVEMGFVELTDEGFLQLLPTLASLPSLCTLSLNGNKLTRAVLRELTDTLKDLDKFPSISWIDLGNNVDIYSLPQPFLVSLRRRCPKHSNLPTILEFAESQSSDPEDSETERCGQLEREAVSALELGTVPGLESGSTSPVPGLESGTVLEQETVSAGLESGTVLVLEQGTVSALESGTVPELESGTVPGLEPGNVPALELETVPELEQEVVPDVEPLLDAGDEGAVGAAGVMPGLT